MPPKKLEQLKWAAADLDEALNESPVRKKKSKSNLEQLKVNFPAKVIPPPEVLEPVPEFIDRFKPEAALHLTKASNSINFAVDKINFYADLLTIFDNKHDNRAIALAEHINEKISKWGVYRDKVQAVSSAITGRCKGSRLE
jgi:hypothetical protein